MERAIGDTRVRLPAGRLAAATAGAALVVGLIASGVVSMGDASSGLWALSAMACIVLPAAFLAALLLAIGPVGLASAGLMLIYGSFGRTIVSLALAAGIFLLAEPPAMPFWASFLLSGVAALVGETLVSIRAMRALETGPHHALTQEQA